MTPNKLSESQQSYKNVLSAFPLLSDVFDGEKDRLCSELEGTSHLRSQFSTDSTLGLEEVQAAVSILLLGLRQCLLTKQAEEVLATLEVSC